MSNLEKALQEAISARKKQSNKSGDPSAVTSNSATEMTTAPSHGSIPAMREETLKDKSQLEKLKIVFPEMSYAKVLDQFREIRTHIYQAIRKNNSPILVSSVSDDAGNTFVTKNIAAAIAFDDAKTSLIVDCNLSNPGLSDLLDDPNGLGVTDYIETGIPLEEIIKPIGIKRMRLISAGAKKESVTDYLTSPRLRTLFSELQERYSDRIILVDSPSITNSADAKILANLFSHFILVVPYRKISEAQLLNAIKTIGKERIIGIVINKEPQFLSLFKYNKHKQ